MSVPLRALIRRRDPRSVLRGLGRERDARRSDRALREAARTGERVVLGPFVGEVGFELLYWIPFARRLLREHGIEPERVTAFTRGGAGAWYADLAGDSLEILDYARPEELRRELEDRSAETGHTKPVRIGSLDRALLERAAPDAAVLHPIVMYTRLRHVWDGLQPLDDLGEVLDYAPLPAPGPPRELPERYAFFRPYFNDCFPDTEGNRRYLDDLLRGLAERGNVVLAAPSLGVDEHTGWEGGGGHDRVELEPGTSLAVQTALVANAQSFVTTHGGLSYLGPLLGVPTLTVRSSERFNRVHFDTLRAALPEVEYSELRVGDPLP